MYPYRKTKNGFNTKMQINDIYIYMYVYTYMHIYRKIQKLLLLISASIFSSIIQVVNNKSIYKLVMQYNNITYL